MSYIGPILKVDKFSLTGGSIRSIKVRITFEIAKALVLGAWIPFRVGYV